MIYFIKIFSFAAVLPLFMALQCSHLKVKKYNFVQPTVVPTSILLITSSSPFMEVTKEVADWMKSKKTSFKEIHFASVNFDGYPFELYPSHYAESDKLVNLNSVTQVTRFLDEEARCFEFTEEVDLLIYSEHVKNLFCVYETVLKELIVVEFVSPQGKAKKAKDFFEELKKHLAQKLKNATIKYGVEFWVTPTS